MILWRRCLPLAPSAEHRAYATYNRERQDTAPRVASVSRNTIVPPVWMLIIVARTKTIRHIAAVSPPKWSRQSATTKADQWQRTSQRAFKSRTHNTSGIRKSAKKSLSRNEDARPTTPLLLTSLPSARQAPTLMTPRTSHCQRRKGAQI